MGRKPTILFSALNASPSILRVDDFARITDTYDDFDFVVDRNYDGDALKVLDLFCGCGGAAIGMHRALKQARVPHWIVGVDLAPQEWYPFERLTGDAVAVAALPWVREFDFIWASPPCQRWSVATPRRSRKNHPNLIAPLRKALLASGVPFAIENVPGAPLRRLVKLCGSMFRDRLGSKLLVRRHRLFEAHGFKIRQRECRHPKMQPVDITGHMSATTYYRSKKHFQVPLALSRAIMGFAEYDFTVKELVQAVPAEYSRYVMKEFLRGIKKATAKKG